MPSSAADLVDELWDQIEKIEGRPVVGDTEDRRRRIGVTGNYQLGVAHPLEVLRSTGDAEGKVRPRLDLDA